MCADCPRRLADDLAGAFPQFLAHYGNLVYGISLRSTKRPADAEDLAQEAFIRAYRALAGYDAERIAELRPRGWLAAIVSNLGRNRAKRKPPAMAGLDTLAEWTDEGTPHPEQVAEQREAARQWRQRLDALPHRYRRAVELRHVSGLSYPELAEALDKPLGTVKSDVHRGVKLLREALMQEETQGSHEVAR
ncbi:MAG: sigma-70 family RNA polymerase sigma factor [Chloroflexota bacterium]|nr:sigma-70 family RNA polymerase sigma factor [Chloroflexota bacterium]